MLYPSKAQLRLWNRLDRSKIRGEAGLFLAEGLKVVQALLESDWEVQALLTLEGGKDKRASFLEWLPDSLPCYGLTAGEWAGLTQDVSPEGIMAVGRIPPRPTLADMTAGADRGPLLLLHEIRNPGNLGALARSASWFGFSGMILGRGSVDPFNPKAIRASMGSLFSLPFVTGVNLQELIPILKKEFLVAGSSPRVGTLPHNCGGKAALLLGSESHGLPDSLLWIADEQWHIPRKGAGESLSLPQAAAIMMYEIAREASPRG